MKHLPLRISDAELALLAKLSKPWMAAAISEQAIRIQVCDGTVVTLTSEGVDMAECFECFRLVVAASRGVVVGEPPVAFQSGVQSVHVLQCDEWLEREHSSVQAVVGHYAGLLCVGMPGSAPTGAKHSCSVDAGVLLRSSTGPGLLIRCAAMPCWLCITDDPVAIQQELKNHGVRDLPRTMPRGED